MPGGCARLQQLRRVLDQRHRGRAPRPSERRVRMDDCGLRTADCGLRTADCGLRTADCGLRTADCGLRTADCGLPCLRHPSETRAGMIRGPFFLYQQTRVSRGCLGGAGARPSGGPPVVPFLAPFLVGRLPLQKTTEKRLLPLFQPLYWRT